MNITVTTILTKFSRIIDLNLTLLFIVQLLILLKFAIITIIIKYFDSYFDKTDMLKNSNITLTFK
jgi:hypothetical protein